MKGRPFNPHEDNILLARRDRGDTWSSIGRYLGRTVHSVKNRYTRLRGPVTRLDDPGGQRALRACLGRLCSHKPRSERMFQSEHPGERICHACKRSHGFINDSPTYGRAL